MQEETLLVGDITAFEMLFRMHYQPLCRYAYSFLQDREEAEEAVQSTFLALWEKKETLSVRTSAKSYLYAMVRNACLNFIKHGKIRQRYEGEEMVQAERSRDSVTQTVTSNELAERISVALEELPEQCRLVFKLSRFEELKYAEIAGHLNISVKTVENHMGRALRLLRDKLKDFLLLIVVMLNGFFG